MPAEPSISTIKNCKIVNCTVEEDWEIQALAEQHESTFKKAMGDAIMKAMEKDNILGFKRDIYDNLNTYEKRHNFNRDATGKRNYNV